MLTLLHLVALAAEELDPNVHLTLASVCYHTRQAVLGHLYHSICCPTAQSLSTFADLLDASPELGALIRCLRLGPWDILASASTSSHDFSGVNPKATGKRASEAGRILARCSRLDELVIWDALLGRPGLASLHEEARLKRLSLPYLWRGGHTIPCSSAPRNRSVAQAAAPTKVTQRSPAAVMPQLEQLEVLEVLLSGLTSSDIASIATFPHLRVFRWFYRPLGLSEIEVLFRKLDEEWKRRGTRPKDMEIFIAANNGKLAQMEGWLAAHSSGSIGLDDAFVQEVTHAMADMEVVEGEKDPETDFLNARRAAGREGFVPGAAPVFNRPQVSSDPAPVQAQAHAPATTTTLMPPSSAHTSHTPRSTPSMLEAGAPPRPDFILGGFPTEDAEDVYARRLSEWQRRLEERQEGASNDVNKAPEPTDYLGMAGQWLREGRLHFDLRRWRAAVMAWELQWADVWERYEYALERGRPQGQPQAQAQADDAASHGRSNPNNNCSETLLSGEDQQEPFLLAHLADAVP